MLAEHSKLCVRLESVTDRQREVLDLLLQHRTSKEIARELNIAPNTVDQRINAVRDKFGAKDRAETARIYARLNHLCGRTTYDPSVVDPTARDNLTTASDDEINPVFMLNDSAAYAIGNWDSSDDLFVRRAKLAESKLWRLMAIVGIAVGVAVLAAIILAVMQALNVMI